MKRILKYLEYTIFFVGAVIGSMVIFVNIARHLFPNNDGHMAILASTLWLLFVFSFGHMDVEQIQEAEEKGRRIAAAEYEKRLEALSPRTFTKPTEEQILARKLLEEYAPKR